MAKLVMSETMYVQILMASFLAGVLTGRKDEKDALKMILSNPSVATLFKKDVGIALEHLQTWCKDDNEEFLSELLPHMAEEKIPQTNWEEMEGVREIAPGIFEIGEYKILKQWLDIQKLEKMFSMKPKEI